MFRSVIKNNKANYLIMILLMILLMKSVAIFTDVIRENIEQCNRYKNLRDQDIYYIKSDVDEYVEKKADKSDDFVPAICDFFDYLYCNDIWFVTVYEHSLGFFDDWDTMMSYVNKEYFDLNKLRLYKGRSFTSDEYLEKNAKIPAIIGYWYHKECGLDIGDCFESGDKEYEVVGIIEKGSHVTNLVGYYEEIDIDKYVFVPMLRSDLLSYDKDNDVSVDSALFRIKIKCDSATASRVAEKVEKIPYMEYKLIKFREVIDESYEIKRDSIIIAIVFESVVGLGMILLFIHIFASFVKNNAGEIVVRYICGAKKRDIILGFFLIVLMIELLSLAGVFVWARFEITVSDIVVALIMGMLLMIYPVWFVKVTSVGSLLKRGE